MGLFNRKEKPVEPTIDQKKARKKRQYDAVKQTLINASWSTTNFHPDSLLRSNLNELQAKCRDAVRNDEYASRALDMVKNNVIGPNGIRLRAQAKNAGGKLDQPAIEAIEREWNVWSRSRYCHISRRFSWLDIQNIVMGNLFVEGEAFIRLHRGSYASEPYKFSVQVIDPTLVDVTLNIAQYNGNTVIGGIEYDRYARPVAYFIKKGATKGNLTQYNHVNDHERVLATEMLHVFMPMSADAKRGQPKMVAGLENLHNLKEFKRSALMAARLGAAKSIFLTEDDQGDSLAPEDIEEEESANNIIDWNPEQLTVLPNGVDIKTFDPTYPNQEFGDFLKVGLQAFASCCNLSYNTLAGDLAGVTFSSLKTGKSEERQSFRVLQNLLIEHLHVPVYEAWLRQQLIHNTILIGETPLKADRFRKYADVKWSAQGWEPIDPVKEAQADAMNLANRTTTRSQIVAKAGHDPDELFSELAYENERLEELGLSTNKTEMVEMTQEEEDED